ncbi:MAG: TerB family tellurite resistance protein [Proteobacteria bacterium]|nr:TerB family tellurite resistance protein [Pseudomonadota bacterium]
MALGLLVGRFGGFIRERHDAPVVAPPSAPQAPMPETLQHAREVCAHHVIPLMLLSRVDGDSAPAEQKAIVAHCMGLLKRSGAKAGPAEQAALVEYVASMQPTLLQLEPALKQVEHEGQDAVFRLIAAAIQVLEADGKRDPAEVKFLDLLSEDLAKLQH